MSAELRFYKRLEIAVRDLLPLIGHPMKGREDIKPDPLKAHKAIQAIEAALHGLDHSRRVESENLSQILENLDGIPLKII
jgi:uncharacterized protein YicC (UPF0701 family)